MTEADLPAIIDCMSEYERTVMLMLIPGLAHRYEPICAKLDLDSDMTKSVVNSLKSSRLVHVRPTTTGGRYSGSGVTLTKLGAVAQSILRER